MCPVRCGGTLWQLFQLGERVFSVAAPHWGTTHLSPCTCLHQPMHSRYIQRHACLKNHFRLIIVIICITDFIDSLNVCFFKRYFVM